MCGFRVSVRHNAVFGLHRFGLMIRLVVAAAYANADANATANINANANAKAKASGW